MAMNTTSSAWYIQGDGNTPSGPFTSDQLIDFWHSKRLNPNVLCWQEGMASWQPFAAVEPFASTLRAEHKVARSRTLRLILVISLTTVALAVVTCIGYYWWTESAMIAHARQLISAERFDEASTQLELLAKQSYFFRRRADYLLALGLVRQFGSAPTAEDAGDELLADASKRFEELFATSSKWREEAKADLNGIVDMVPNSVPCSLERSFQLASFLSDMQLADREELSKELLHKAKTIWAEPQSGPKNSHGEVVAWIVGDDAALVDETVASIISETPDVETNLDHNLACIQHWARSQAKLAPLFGVGIVKRADSLMTSATLDKRHRLIVAAKQIDSQFDMWHYWEREFQRVNTKSAQDAIEILTFMVDGEHNVERLRDATGRYRDLRKRFPSVEMKPPPEIRDAVDAVSLHELIADADELAKNGQYRDARMKLDDAQRQFSSAWSRDTDAAKLDSEVDFHLHFAKARQFHEANNFVAALKEMNAALQILPEDKEALDLRHKIQIAADKMEFEQYRQKAQMAMAADNPHTGVGELLEAYRIVEKPSNAAWATASRKAVDKLAKNLIEKLHEQAAELSDKRQYEDAKEKLRRGLQLPSKDEKLTQLLEEIGKREADPQTANVSGMWVNSVGVVCKLIDNGTNKIGFQAVRLPKSIQSCTGEWTRKRDKLEGKFRVVFVEIPQQNTEGTVAATIQGINRLDVLWQDIIWLDKPKNGTWTWRGKGKGTWTKQESGADDSDDPESQPSVSQRSPNKSKLQNNQKAPSGHRNLR